MNDQLPDVCCTFSSLFQGIAPLHIIVCYSIRRVCSVCLAPSTNKGNVGNNWQFLIANLEKSHTSLRMNVLGTSINSFSYRDRVDA